MNQYFRRRASAANRPKRLSIGLSPIPFNEAAAYVESVCASLIDSRCGPGRETQSVIRFSNEPELEPAVFCDLSEGEMVPCYAVEPLGRKGEQLAGAEYRRAKQLYRLAAKPGNTAPISAPNQGRGSP